MRRKPRLLMVEVSAREDFQRAHIPGAMHQSEAEICEDFPAKCRDKDQEIVLYGANPLSFGPRRAARLLEALGYVNLYFYSGGKDEWVSQGRRTESYYARPESPDIRTP